MPSLAASNIQNAAYALIRLSACVDTTIPTEADTVISIDPFPLLRHNYVKRAKVRIY